MTLTVALIIGLIVSLFIIKIVLKTTTPEEEENEKLISKTHSRIAKAHSTSFSHSLYSTSNEKKRKEDYYKNAVFINKECKSLEDFIINNEINEYDLKKLADLNFINLQVSSAWHPLLIELIKELNEHGWNKRVTCIKAKYAELRFYLDKDDNYKTLSEIVNKYEEKSRHICETCGEKGAIRYNTGWEYVACIKHYFETRKGINIEGRGFAFKDAYYRWDEVKDIWFEDLDYYKKYRSLTIELIHSKSTDYGWIDNKIFVSRFTLGFGHFLTYIPEIFSKLDFDYINHFKNVEFCDVCGYKAVYFGECECCETDTWETYCEKGNNLDDIKSSYVSSHQIFWKIDGGESYEVLNSVYAKNPNHKILYTEQELKQYTEDYNNYQY